VNHKIIDCIQVFSSFRIPVNERPLIPGGFDYISGTHRLSGTAEPIPIEPLRRPFGCDDLRFDYLDVLQYSLNIAAAHDAPWLVDLKPTALPFRRLLVEKFRHVTTIRT
jgi:hypothetical protein